MTPADLEAARDRFGMTPAEFADALELTLYEVEQFSSGVRAMSRRVAWRLRAMIVEHENARLMAASGLPRCDEDERLMARVETALEALRAADTGWLRNTRREHAAMRAATDAIDSHRDGCATCRARRAYMKQHFQPLPELPAAWPFAIVERIEGAVRVLVDRVRRTRLPPVAR